MDTDAIDTMAVIARGALEEEGYGATFGHGTEEGHRAFYVTDLASGRVLAEIVIKASDPSESRPDEPMK
jgi:hypothetical protein